MAVAALQVATSGYEERDDRGVNEADDLTGTLLVASPRLGRPELQPHGRLRVGPRARRCPRARAQQAHGSSGGRDPRPMARPGGKAEPAVIFSGGPVSPGAVIGLVKRPPVGEPAGWHAVLGEIGTVDLSVAPEDQPEASAGTRLFSGYAGWSARQLDEEIGRGCVVLPGCPRGRSVDGPARAALARRAPAPGG